MTNKNNFILRGPELKFTNKSFGEIIYNGLKKGGRKIAMVNSVTDESYTYNSIFKSSINLANYLINTGLMKEDTIAICSENNLEFCIPVISGIYLGITVAPISCDLLQSKCELLHVLILANPKVIFTTGGQLKQILEVTNKINSIKKIILLGKYIKPVPSSVQLSSIIRNDLVQEFACPSFDLTQNAFLLFSSGTTGLPKGVLHSHKSLQVAYAYNSHPDYGNFNSSKIGMNIYPFHAAFSLTRLLCMLVSNMRIVFLPTFKKSLLLLTIQKYRVTNVLLTPAIISFLATSPLVDQYDVSSISDIMSSSSSLGKDVIDLAEKRFKGCNIRQAYGLSETMAITFIPSYCNRPGSVGKLVPGWECKIINPRTKEVLGPNQQGELCARGPSIMNGYLGNPVATAEIIDEQGWLHTGDVACFDNEGFIYIMDRYKDIIKFKGFHVSPLEVENVLLKHPQVKDCAVIGKPDNVVGELPTAFIVPNEKAKITAQDLIKYVAENVSYPKRLHGGVIFVENIPKTSTGKKLRRALKEDLSTFPNKL